MMDADTFLVRLYVSVDDYCKSRGIPPTALAGRALVAHADADDYHSQPAGNAGARIACGVIRVTR